MTRVQKKRRPEEIIGEWGIRDVTPPSQRERERILADRDVNPLIGSALPRRIRLFRADPDTYLAALGGPLPYMQRLRQIEAETERQVERLAEAYREHEGDPDGWRQLAGRWDFGEVNDLIARHNRWFPAEARLPMDPQTRDFVRVGGRPYHRKPLDAAWILQRFPA